MLGIIFKDFYETFCLKKNLLGMLFVVICFGAIFLTMKNYYALLLIVCVSTPYFGITTMQCSMEQDEICNFDQILLTYPLTRQEIIKAKFISNTILVILSNVLISLPCILIYVYIYKVCDLDTGIAVGMTGFIISFIFTAINSIGFMTLGNKKGSFAFIVFVVAYAIFYMALNYNFDLSKFYESPNQLLIAGVLIAIILYILSYYLCLKIYNIKHS